MESDRIKMKTLLVATVALMLLESVSFSAMSAAMLPAMVATGLTRCVGIGILLAITLKMQARLDAIGLRPSAIGSGILRGILWSMGFGAVVAVGWVAARLAGIIPGGLFQTRGDLFSWVGLRIPETLGTCCSHSGKHPAVCCGSSRFTKYSDSSNRWRPPVRHFL